MSLLRDAISKLIQPICSTPSICERFLNDEAMIIWERAVTHSSYDLNNNYEDLEYLGDSILKATFSWYLSKRLPIHENKQHLYTMLSNNYMALEYQAGLTDKMGLTEFIRLSSRITYVPMAIRTDVFEAFFGALATIADLIRPGVGMGLAYCQQMVNHLFEPITIDVTYGKGANKTEVQQTFKRFRELPPDEKKEEIEGVRVRVTINLTPSNITFLRSHGFTVTTSFLGQATAYTAEVATLNAYHQAGATLRALGATLEWANELKRQQAFDNLHDPKLVADVEAKAKREGFSSLQFNKQSKMDRKHEQYLQLIGSNETGKYSLADMMAAVQYHEDRTGNKVKNTDNLREAQKELLRQYLSTSK